MDDLANSRWLYRAICPWVAWKRTLPKPSYRDQTWEIHHESYSGPAAVTGRSWARPCPSRRCECLLPAWPAAMRGVRRRPGLLRRRDAPAAARAAYAATPARPEPTRRRRCPSPPLISPEPALSGRGLGSGSGRPRRPSRPLRLRRGGALLRLRLRRGGALLQLRLRRGGALLRLQLRLRRGGARLRLQLRLRRGGALLRLRLRRAAPHTATARRRPPTATARQRL